MSKVIAFPVPEMPPPTRQELLARVRALVLLPDRMHMDEPHFRLRLWQRKVSMRQVLEVIKSGEVTDGPRLDEYGDWRIKIVRKVAGRRVQVVVAVSETYFTPVTVI